MVSVGSEIGKKQGGLVLHGLRQSFLMVIGCRFRAVDLAQQCWYKSASVGCEGRDISLLCHGARDTKNTHKRGNLR
jgi:hypothetical protein